MKLLYKGTAYLPEYRGWHEGRMVHVHAGGTLEINDTQEVAVLLKDFPGIFVPAEPEGRSMDCPPVDKQIKAPRVKK